MAQFGSAGAAPRRCRLHWLGAVPLLLALSCGGSTPGPYESLTEPGANAGETAPPQRPNVRSLDPVAANGEVERASASPGLAALPADPGTPVSPELGPSQQEELQAMRARLDEVDELGTDELLARYPSSMTGDQGYDPLTAIGVDLLQASDLALNDAEQAVLESSGLVISERQSFPTFTYGYDSIYAADLPLFVSADSILNAVHRSYDRILQQLERQELLPSLDHMLAQMREGLAEAAIADPTRADMDLYLAVATSLLDGNVAVPIAGAEPAQVELLFSLAQAAAAPSQLVLFGERREIDFSQMRPRGHYDDNGDLARYFRAMMWLGRIDLRLVEALPDQTYVFNRRQLEAAVALRDLMTPAARDDWSAIDSVIAGFVGEADGMTLTELDALLSDLELTDLASLADMSDTDLAQAIVESGYGTPRVASQLLLNGSSGPMALTASFSLFGQRYLIDSHVLSNVTYDRVPVRAGAAPRLMPDPLDVAFAALGNDQAAALLNAVAQMPGRTTGPIPTLNSDSPAIWMTI